EGEAVTRALLRLEEAYREVLVLRELEELSYKDIATVVGAPVGTVMSRLARARRRLREELGGSVAAA
ncbi:MAG TPA: sigma-70 family RNA polymerase sigma factor, partial [Burkholderiales bacterium]|nr:sigma-70 family RNA polymerase sigma factor [Burkholderiales bacterium]